MPKACAGEGKRNSSRVPKATTPCPSPPGATRSRSRAASPPSTPFCGQPHGRGRSAERLRMPPGLLQEIIWRLDKIRRMETD